MPRSVPVVLTLASLGVLSACRPDTGLTKFNSEPEAQITAPSDGAAVLEGTTVTLRGQASDPNHPTTQLLARWFAGDTEACASTAPAADGTTTCDVLVPDGDALAVRLEVLDPEGSAGTAEASYAITPNQAPLASIASPSADGVYYSDQLVVLRATVDDAEDEASALQVRWESNRDGELGQATPNSEGLVESFVNLTQGAHAVQVFVTDSAGNEGQATVLVDVGPPNTAPGCGITAPSDGGAGVDGARVDFVGAVSDVDIPSDRLSVRWTSDKDGDLGASTPDTAGSVTFSTSALSVNTHRITMTVTDEVGATCTTGLTWTVGTPPEVTLETPLPGEVVNEGEGLSFSAIVSDREDVAGDLTVRWESDRDGLLYEGPPDSTGVSQFIARDLTAGDHVLTVTVTDSTGLTATTLGTYTVNGIPGAPTISLTPTTPATDDDLVVRIDAPAVDPEGDPLTYTYAWTRDGVASAASTSATLPASATTDGEVWAVEVSASDGLASGPLARARVTIANSVPTLASASITPDPARRNDTLTCTASGYRDADGDPDLSTYAWTVNGTAAGTGATLTGPFVVGALVACTVTPNDGKDTGTPVRDSVTIENTLPVVSSVTLTPTTVFTNDTLTANAVSSDPDGDSVTLRYRWFKDGVEIAGATGSSLSGALRGSFDRDDVVTVEVTPNDGVTDGASVVSAGVTVRNTAPTTPTIAITPAAPSAGDALTCSVVTPATDVDGDTVSYAFAWDQDGASYAGASSGGTSSTVAGADIGGSETWTCEVTAGDGTATSRVVTAGVTIRTPQSCADIIARTDGVYRIEPDSSGSFDAYCDLTHDGGGWTLLLAANGTSTYWGNNSTNWMLPGHDIAPPSLTGADYHGEAYARLDTSEIRLCLADMSHCYTFAHGMGLSLQDFFTSGTSYVVYAHDAKGFTDTGSAGSLNGYETALGHTGTRWQCQWLGINHADSHSAIGMLADDNAGCTSNAYPGPANMDDSALGLGLASCQDNNGCPSGGTGHSAGRERYVDGIDARGDLGPWYVFGR